MRRSVRHGHGNLSPSEGFNEAGSAHREDRHSLETLDEIAPKD